MCYKISNHKSAQVQFYVGRKLHCFCKGGTVALWSNNLNFFHRATDMQRCYSPNITL